MIKMSWMMSESRWRELKFGELMREFCRRCEFGGDFRKCGGVRMEGWMLRCLKVEIDGFSLVLKRVRLKSGWSRWRDWDWFERMCELGMF